MPKGRFNPGLHPRDGYGRFASKSGKAARNAQKAASRILKSDRFSASRSAVLRLAEFGPGTPTGKRGRVNSALVGRQIATISGRKYKRF